MTSAVQVAGGAAAVVLVIGIVVLIVTLGNRHPAVEATAKPSTPAAPAQTINPATPHADSQVVPLPMRTPPLTASAARKDQASHQSTNRTNRIGHLIRRCKHPSAAQSFGHFAVIDFDWPTHRHNGHYGRELHFHLPHLGLSSRHCIHQWTVEIFAKCTIQNDPHAALHRSVPDAVTKV